LKPKPRPEAAQPAPHECGPDCPGAPGVLLTEARTAEIFEAHRGDLEAILARQQASEKHVYAGARPDWWWSYAAAARPFRERPEDYQRPWMVERDPASDWPRGHDLQRWARLCFLAASGELADWEAHSILGLAPHLAAYPKYAPEVKAVREGLTMRSRQGGAP
jgi:hypothetical protein